MEAQYLSRYLYHTECDVFSWGYTAQCFLVYSSYTYTTALGNRDISSWVPIDSGAQIYVDGYGMHITLP